MRSSFVAVTLALGGCGSWSVHASPQAPNVDKEQVRAVIVSHVPEVQDCWQRRVNQGMRSARIFLRIRIVAGGGVGRAWVPRADVRDEGLERCVVDRALGWKFPPPDNNGTIDVEYPYVMKTD